MQQKQTNRDYNQYFGLAAFMGCAILLVLVFSFIPDAPTPTEGIPHNYWIPTEEDQMYLDSLYDIVEETNNDLDTIRGDVDRIIKKLDVIIYENGQSDSIRLYEDQHVKNYDKHMNEQ